MFSYNLSRAGNALIVQPQLAVQEPGAINVTVLELDRDALMQGVDTSSYDGKIDWKKVAETKKFAWLRVSHGLEHDKTFAEMWPKAREAGVVRGAYHYFLPN